MQTEDQKRAYQEMIGSINEWRDNLDIFDSTMKTTEVVLQTSFS